MDKGEDSGENGRHTLLTLSNKMEASDQNFSVVVLSSLTTQLREWAALASVRQHELMPLTPYILRALPVVSSQTLL
jgi:hypothetical protein